MSLFCERMIGRGFAMFFTLIVVVTILGRYIILCCNKHDR